MESNTASGFDEVSAESGEYGIPARAGFSGLALQK